MPVGLAVHRGARNSLDGEEIGIKPRTIKALPVKNDGEEITQGVLDLGIEKDTEINGIGMGVLSDGTPYLNQRGLAALCGVQNAHIGTISAQWDDADPKPRIKAIKGILSKLGLEASVAHIEVPHNGVVHYCYPAEVCLAILGYYAFDAGTNCQPEARDNFRILAGTKLREMIYSQVGYDPTGRARFDKWHERIALNYQSAPKGFFSVFNEAETLIYEMIVAGAPVDEKNVVDIWACIGRSSGTKTASMSGLAIATSSLTGTPIATRRRSPTLRRPGAIRSKHWVRIGSGCRITTSAAANSGNTSMTRRRRAPFRRL